jgi:hypothetical protein
LLLYKGVPQVDNGINRLSRHKEISRVRPAGRVFILFHGSIDTAAHLLEVVVKALATQAFAEKT